MLKMTIAALLLATSAHATDGIVVGSKIFTESYLLAETAAQIIEASSLTPVTRRMGMGSTGILFESLKNGAIDVYPDYSGTLAETLLKNPDLRSLDDIRRALAPLGLTLSDSLGFNNTYSLAVKESFAEAHHLESISDLNQVAGVRAAFSYEFMDRKDGYVGLVARYGLKFDPDKVNRMEHSLVYKAIDDRAVDLIEVYSTDANLQKFGLRVLRDDRAYFPRYEAVWVARLDFVKRYPAEWRALRKYEHSIDNTHMIAMNAAAEMEKTSYARIAAGFLHRDAATDNSEASELLRRTKEHLTLVGLSLVFAILVGIPLGIMATRLRIAGQAILLFSALIQTVPTLALLCFLIPLFGVGTKPALVALCLYSLLPVVLNTFTGIQGVEPRHLENAQALGLSRTEILRRIVLPIASPTILAGVKTSTIVGIGTATLAALIGAGGYGAFIISGLSLNNTRTILMGAVPAALLALLAHFVFDGIDRVFIPKGLREHSEREDE